jgi:hypothetical protein
MYAVTVIAPEFDEGSLTSLGVTWRKRERVIV